MGAAGGRRTNQRVDKKPRDPCAVVSANCCPKGARRDDRFEEKLGLEAPIAAILALFSHKRVARATSRGSGEASRVGAEIVFCGNDMGASLSGCPSLKLSKPTKQTSSDYDFICFGSLKARKQELSLG